MEKKLKFKDIEPPKEQSTINETVLLESLNNFLDGKIEYEKLKEKLKEAENEEDYKKLLKELKQKKEILIEFSLGLKELKISQKFILNEIYTYDQIEEIKKEIENKILNKKGIYPN
jgi:hypothetical protein